MLLEQIQGKGQYHILGGTEVGEEMLGMGFALTGHTNSYRKRGKISNNSGAEKELFGKIPGSLQSSQQAAER